MTELMVRAPAKADFHLRPLAFHLRPLDFHLRAGSQFFIKNHDFFHLRPCTIFSKYCV